MITNFGAFAAAVRRQFETMAGEPLFTAGADRDAIWEAYLGAFPPGSNPVFRARTEHDCSCCRAFIRAVGPVVAVQNGALVTVWDLAGLPDPYQPVADAMAAYVRGLAVSDVFLTRDRRLGTAVSHEHVPGGSTLTWEHFQVAVPARFVTDRVAERRGAARTTFEVLRRGLAELSPEVVETVLDLIDRGALYRGEQFADAVRQFRQLQSRVAVARDTRERDLLAWYMVDSAAARFRNTAIGTLVQDLSAGADLEVAVRGYEAKVAPQNYRRPTALITRKMVEDAVATIRALDLEPALARRHARLEDVSVNSVLFVDGSVRGRMKGGVEDLLLEEAVPARFDPDRAEEIAVEDFVTDVLPRCTGVQVYLENRLARNFVSLTAPVHEDSGRLFTWGNDFAWSYEGDAADSIKERVKRAGGRVEGVALRASLSWYNYDDLDIHVREPDGNHVYYGNKSDKLDVDMNAHGGTTRDPVENVRWVGRLRHGAYTVWVNQFRRRESVDVGFEVEVEHDGGLENFRYEKGLRHNQDVPVAVVHVERGEVKKVTPSAQVIAGSAAREHWGLTTQRLVRANAVVLSPNYWSEPGTGNRHWFFILEGCRNPAPARGIYNEFLSPALAKHRKVFEVLGDKTKCPPADEQLSGVGFSAGRDDRVAVAVVGQRMNRVYRIVF